MNDPNQVVAEAVTQIESLIERHGVKGFRLDLVIQDVVKKATDEAIADRDEARAQRDWLIKECERIGVTVSVQIGAPITEAYRLSRRAAHTSEKASSQTL